ncbi:hypothetical protein SAMN05421720_11930 [Rhodospira trueperi]|uniref:Transposase n=1 Tax=Rhodospira trueperi TaxID=69960 RepID=A0A1G7HBI4_9PROT|nr:hypothetical protein SAMN05421720_11930 [Rhodospira trueperi]
MGRHLAWFEAHPDLDTARRHGRSPRGERCRAAVPHGHWKTTTLVAALRLESMTAPKPSTPYPLPNAPTTSSRPGMIQSERKAP